MSNVINLADYRPQRPGFEPHFEVMDYLPSARAPSGLDRLEIVGQVGSKVACEALVLAQELCAASARDAAVRPLRPTQELSHVAPWPGLFFEQQEANGAWHIDVVLTRRRAAAFIAALLAAGVADWTVSETATG